MGGGGNLAIFGSPVSIGTPSWVYSAPAPLQPAQVVAAIPAPVVPIPAGKEFGEPSWVKVIKTTTHNANDVVLQDLISDDTDGDGLANWQNNEPDEVETEWKLLQANTGANPAKAELEGGADDMGDGSETVTRRYEFYRYAAAPDTLDGENGEAMCSEVNPVTDPNDPNYLENYLHGVGSAVAVTDANGDTYYVDCAAQVVVGTYIGAQMAGFDAAAPLGLIDNLQDAEQDQPYTARTIVVGGDSPFTISITQGNLPAGMVLGDYLDPTTNLTSLGVLSGTPTASGDFAFTVEATDAGNVMVSKAYTLHVTGPVVSTTTTTTSEPTTTTTSSTTTTLLPTTTTLEPTTTTTTTLEPTTTSTTSSTTTTLEPTTTSTSTSTTSSSTTTTSVPPNQLYALSVTHTGPGTVTSNPKGIKCGRQCSKTFTVGTSVTLTAKPKNKHLFLGWTGACSGEASPICTVLMVGDQAVGASFD